MRCTFVNVFVSLKARQSFGVWGVLVTGVTHASNLDKTCMHVQCKVYKKKCSVVRRGAWSTTSVPHAPPCPVPRVPCRIAPLARPLGQPLATPLFSLLLCFRRSPVFSNILATRTGARFVAPRAGLKRCVVVSTAPFLLIADSNPFHTKKTAFIPLSTWRLSNGQSLSSYFVFLL